jgi:hypothetical protein
MTCLHSESAKQAADWRPQWRLMQMGSTSFGAKSFASAPKKPKKSAKAKVLFTGGKFMSRVHFGIRVAKFFLVHKNKTGEKCTK